MSASAGAISAEQGRLIARSREFITARAESGLDVALDPQCYLNSWAPCLGNARLREIAYGARGRPARLLARARDAASTLRFKSAVLAGETDAQPRGFGNLVVSWALPTDFDEQGNYRDRYLNLGSADTPGTLWFLILLSGTVPSCVAGNVRVLHRPGHGHTHQFRGRFNAFSGTVAQAREIAALVATCQRRYGFGRVLMPYEAQPFQHAANLAVKACDPRVVTVGYVHSSLPALPTDYLLRHGAPDRLLVHGEGQAEILTRDLGWAAERVEIIDSLRYLRDAGVSFAGNILLPYDFDDAEFIAGRVAAMLSAATPGSMPRWKVRNHPVKGNSAPHLALTQQLEAIIARFADRGTDAPRAAAQTLMIGATAAVIEALERGLDVVHLCTNELFERYCMGIWTRLDIEELPSNFSRYRLRESGAYIRLGTDARLTARTLGLH